MEENKKEQKTQKKSKAIKAATIGIGVVAIGAAIGASKLTGEVLGTVGSTSKALSGLSKATRILGIFGLSAAAGYTAKDAVEKKGASLITALEVVEAVGKVFNSEEESSEEEKEDDKVVVEAL